jgi:hypothetical protein
MIKVKATVEWKIDLSLIISIIGLVIALLD